MRSCTLWSLHCCDVLGGYWFATSAGSEPASTSKHTPEMLFFFCLFLPCLLYDWHAAGQATLLLFRVRSTRLWSLLHSYGRLQRWNVRPVNTEGRKKPPHVAWTLNPHQIVRLQNRRHQVVLCNAEGGGKRGALVKNYVWWCMQNEGKSPLGLNAMVVQYLHAYCKAVHCMWI